MDEVDEQEYPVRNFVQNRLKNPSILRRRSMKISSSITCFEKFKICLKEVLGVKRELKFLYTLPMKLFFSVLQLFSAG
jgi:hypothetical protein